MPATVLGGYVSDRFRRLGKGGRMAVSAWAALASIPLWLGLLFSNSIGFLVFLNVLLFGFALMWVAPATADLHEIAGPHLRGFGIGIFFSAVNPAVCALAAILLWRGSRARVAEREG